MSVACDEYNDFQSEQRRRARKEHRCGACHEPIRRGDVYVVTTIGSYGSIETVKHCLRCSAIAHALWDAGVEMIDMHLNCGHTWEDNEDIEVPLPESVAALAFMTADEAQRLLAPPKLAPEPA